MLPKACKQIGTGSWLAACAGTAASAAKAPCPPATYLLPQVCHAAGDDSGAGIGKGGDVVASINQDLRLHDGHDAAGLQG